MSADGSVPAPEAGPPYDALSPADDGSVGLDADASVRPEVGARDAAPRDALPTACSPGQDFVSPGPDRGRSADAQTPPTLPGWEECMPAGGSTACSLPVFDEPSPLRLQMSFFAVPTEQAMASAALCSPIVPGEPYALALDVALEGAPFDGGKSAADVAIEIWAGAIPCEADLPLATSPMIPNTCAWTSLCLSFVAPAAAADAAARTYPYLAVNAYSASLGLVNVTDYVLVDRVRFVGSCSGSGAVP